MFEDGIGNDVGGYGAVGWYHEFVIPYCYNKTFFYMNDTYGQRKCFEMVLIFSPNVSFLDFVEVNETLLPVFYYNFFSCQERAVEFLCRYKITI